MSDEAEKNNSQAVPLAQELPPKQPEEAVQSSQQQPDPSPTVSLNSQVNSDESNIPEQVRANLDIDKKKYTDAKIQAQPTINEKTKKISLKNTLKWKSTNKIFRVILVLFICTVTCFTLMIIITLTNVDTKIVKLTLEGTVTDKLLNTPIANAKLFLEGEEVAITDSTGHYSITGLEPKVAKLKVTAEGYNDLEQDVAISRGVLQYTVKLDLALLSREVGILTGKFSANSTSYDFIGDQLLLNDKEYKINKDGTFRIEDAPVGRGNLKFRSINFLDLDNDIEIKTGSNQLEDIVLKSAGDVIGEALSWVREDLVLNAKFSIENVLTTQVDFNDEGQFRIKDLDVGRKYKIRVTADGYRTRDYEVQIKQGDNRLFNFRIVENGEAIYTRNVKEGSAASNNIYKADFDGQSEVQVTNINNLNPEELYYTPAERKIYFMDKFEKLLKNTSGSIGGPVYMIDIDTSTMTRLTANLTSIGNLYPNYEAKKLINVVSGSFSSPVELFVMDLDGNNRQKVKELAQSQTFDNILLASSGRYIFFSEKGKNDKIINNLYRYDLQTSETITISTQSTIVLLDVSFDGNKVLYSSKNSSTGFTVLSLYTVSSKENRTLDENMDGSGYTFITGDTEIIYFAERSSRYNIYKFTVEQNRDDQVTNLGPDDKITSIYLEDKNVFYLTNKGLNVLSIDKPKNFKLVATNVDPKR